MLKDYFYKMRGSNKSPPAVSAQEIIWSWIGAFFGIAAVAYINFNMIEETDLLQMPGISKRSWPWWGNIILAPPEIVGNGYFQVEVVPSLLEGRIR